MITLSIKAAGQEADESELQDWSACNCNPFSFSPQFSYFSQLYTYLNYFSITYTLSLLNRIYAGIPICLLSVGWMVVGNNHTRGSIDILPPSRKTAPMPPINCFLFQLVVCFRQGYHSINMAKAKVRELGSISILLAHI